MVIWQRRQLVLSSEQSKSKTHLLGLERRAFTHASRPATSGDVSGSIPGGFRGRVPEPQPLRETYSGPFQRHILALFWLPSILKPETKWNHGTFISSAIINSYKTHSSIKPYLSHPKSILMHHFTPYSLHSKNTQQQSAPPQEKPSPPHPPFHSRRRLLAGQARPASAMQRWGVPERVPCSFSSPCSVSSVVCSVSALLQGRCAAACVLLRVACLLGACLLACLLAGAKRGGRLGPMSVRTYCVCTHVCSCPVGTHACLLACMDAVW